MTFDEFKRVLLTPYWVEDPTAWATQGAGIAFFANDGRVGMFNLALLVLDCEAPPPLPVYQQRDLAWVIQSSPMIGLGGMTLEHHAAVKTLPDFCRLLKNVHCESNARLQQLYLAGLKRLTYDIRHRRAAR